MDEAGNRRLGCAHIYAACVGLSGTNDQATGPEFGFSSRVLKSRAVGGEAGKVEVDRIDVCYLAPIGPICRRKAASRKITLRNGWFGGSFPACSGHRPTSYFAV